jgi:nickel transport system permease protein
LTVLVSLPLGVLSALHRESALDHFCRLFSFVGASIPSFWLGFLLIHLVSVKLGWLPTFGRGGPAHLILPAFTLSFMFMAVFIRLIRTGVLENLNQRFVLYARARGVRERWVIGKHVMKSSLLPVVTALGMSAGSFIGGSVMVESVFAWPGLGEGPTLSPKASELRCCFAAAPRGASSIVAGISATELRKEGLGTETG